MNKCREKGLILAKTTVYSCLEQMIENGLINKDYILTNLGKSTLLMFKEFFNTILGTHHIQNRILEETLILSIVQRLPDINCGQVTKLCNNKGFRFASRTVNDIVLRLLNEELLMRKSSTYKLTITRFGESRLLSNKCILRQVLF
jgi:hypothetical protein